MTIESHPLEPFLPKNGKILFLGSFPPPKARWSIEFFYPNWINDMWRIMGINFFGDSHHFEIEGQKKFDKEKIVEFCKKEGLAFFDTATKVCRHKDNASDDFLEILEPTDVYSLLQEMPSCTTVVTTGGKASEEFFRTCNCNSIPKVGEMVPVTLKDKQISWFRMPSSSRAYPLSLSKKAEYYKRLSSR